MNKKLSKTTMQRTHYRYDLLKILQMKPITCIQNNTCVSFLWKETKQYLANLNEKDVTDNRKLCHTIKLFFLKKLNQEKVVHYIEISKEDQVGNTLNDFFSNIVKNLNFPEHHVNAVYHRLYQVFIKVDKKSCKEI